MLDNMGCSASVKSMYSDLSVDRSHFFFSKVIGAGGFGTVYSAIHTDYHTWFAVKRINKSELLKHKSGLDMLFGELRAWQRVDHHAYIADLHFAFQDSSSCYFVMDLLTGADLRYYIKKRIILTEPELAFIVGCISSALHHIHTKHVLHRDVKPENIVFDHNGFPHLTDFGVSYVCTSTELVCNLSSGTKQYLAPEIFMKSHVHGPESDFWSLAVLIYEIMFGRRPFEKHVPREFIAHVEMEANMKAKIARASPITTSNRYSPCLGSSSTSATCATGSTSPIPIGGGRTGAYSPALESTAAMSGAVSLCTSVTPPPKASRSLLQPITPVPLSHAAVVAPSPNNSPAEPAVLLGSMSASALSLGQSLPACEGFPVQEGRASSKLRVDELDGLRVNALPTLGSRAGAASVASMLRLDEAKRATKSPPGMMMGKKDLKGKLAPVTPGSKKADLSVLVDCLPESKPFDEGSPEIRSPPSHQSSPKMIGFSGPPIVPETEDDLVAELIAASASVNDDGAVDRKPPALPDNLKVTIPRVTMYNEPVTPTFVNFLSDMMEIRPEYRLGGMKNYDAFVRHPWFKECKLDWAKIRNKTARPPFVPNKEQIQYDMAGKHHDVDPDEFNPGKTCISHDKQVLFMGYHHVAREYVDLFPTLAPHETGAGNVSIRCRRS